jgi:HD-GYP domain-containing protein (c-di-GMP phosphodiesterase class II)
MNRNQAGWVTFGDEPESEQKHTVDMDSMAVLPAQDLNDFNLGTLNLGDFVSENLISEGLARRLQRRVQNEPEQLRLQLQELVSLYSLEKTLNVVLSSKTEAAALGVSPKRLMHNAMCATLATLFQAEGCHLFEFVNNETTGLTLQGSTQWLKETVHYTESHPLMAFYTQALKLGAFKLGKQKALVLEPLPELAQELGFEADALLEQLALGSVQSVLLVPLWEGTKASGLLVWHNNTAGLFTEVLEALAVQVAGLISQAEALQQQLNKLEHTLNAPQENPFGPGHTSLLGWRADLTEKIAEVTLAQQAFLEALAGVMDERHGFPAGASQVVAETVQCLAEKLELNEKTVDLLYYAALYGKVGLSSVPKGLLEETSPLTASQWERVRQHPNAGVTLMMHLYALGELLPYVQYQNERWDGSGLPEGLKGQNIPLGSRLLGVAQAYSALRHPRPFRTYALPANEALEVLKSEAGTLWDPMVVATLEQVLEQGLLL